MKLFLSLFFFSLSICSLASAKNDLARQKIKGQVKSVTELEYNETGDSLKWKTVGRYNDSGNLVDFCTYSAAGILLSRSVFIYNDTTGLLIEERRFKADSSLIVRVKYVFDGQGNKTEEHNFDVSGKEFMKVSSKYDIKGNRTVKDSYNEYGILFLKANSKFDPLGNEIQIKEYDSHHGLKYEISYDYNKTDSNGNWTSRITNKNDDPASVTIRVFNYR
jgi:hypothetical protein